MKNRRTPVPNYPVRYDEEMRQAMQTYLAEKMKAEIQYKQDKKNWKRRATIASIMILAAFLSYFLYFDSPII
jgi:F0F1-type ATP synthase assembly protein I